MEEEEVFVGCMSCMSNNDLCDLFAIYTDNEETYAKMLETCFEIKVSNDLKYICAQCIEKLERATEFKDQTIKNIAVLQSIKDEEYLDESILEEAESGEEQNLQKVLVIKKSGNDSTNEEDADVKLCNNQPPKYVHRERQKCPICDRDFSQKQILNKHLLKAHGYEVEKRKAFICPLCNARVSYGAQFSRHLLHEHDVQEQVERLQFHNIDDFMLYKSAIQEETKCRFRKTTASKQTIEGVRSHYMCSQSGVYVYQGKGKRPAPERQIYKTGKACPAHMIVTETLDHVLVTFYKTHVGHGVCPYYEPRKPKMCTLEAGGTPAAGDSAGGSGRWICDECGALFVAADQFRAHAHAHGLPLFVCQRCDRVFQNIDAWRRHLNMEHNMDAIF